MRGIPLPWNATARLAQFCAHLRRQILRPHRIRNRLGHNTIDLRHGRGVELPAHHAGDCVQLIGPLGSPQRHRDPRPVKHPPRRQLSQRFPKALPGQRRQPLDGRHILTEARLLELWIDGANISWLKRHAAMDAAAKQAAA